MKVHRQNQCDKPSIALVVFLVAATGMSPSGVCGWNTQAPILRSRAPAWKPAWNSLPTTMLSMASPTVLRAARTDDSDATSESSTEQQQQPQPLSEADRKELVDALFKGTSKSGSGRSTPSSSSRNTNADDDISNKISGFLDQPFFDPNNYDEDDDSFLGKIANFVRNDYELFEAVFVACFFLLLITITKDLLRAQMVASGIGGKMF